MQTPIANQPLIEREHNPKAGHFFLEILTPERSFLSSDDVQALTFDTTDGEMTILAGHAAISAPLVAGSVNIKIDGEWKEAFQSEGFVEVDDHGVHVFVQACEWPGDIDFSRATEAENRALERMRQQKSMVEYQWTKAALARAMARLRVKNRYGK